MTSYKLTYFPVRGFGEFIRLIFHYSNVPFEDNRVSFEDWPNLKPSKLSCKKLSTKVVYRVFYNLLRTLKIRQKSSLTLPSRPRRGVYSSVFFDALSDAHKEKNFKNCFI